MLKRIFNRVEAMRPHKIGWRRFLFCFTLFLLLLHVLFYAVVRLNQDSVIQRPPKKQKFDHIIQGPAAGQGLPNRLQCQETRALNRTHSVALSNSAASSGDGIAFVTVFTVYNKTAIDLLATADGFVTVGNASYSKTDRALAILNVFINFIQVMMPKSSVFIVTDPASSLSLHRSSVTVYPIQGEYSRDRLMLQRIRSYISFLDTRLQKLSQDPQHINNIIFTDSDIAVVGDLGDIFRNYSNFDVALTFRNNKEQPLNSGFIAVRGTRHSILRAKLFLQKVLRIYSSRYMNASRMLGDQLALASVIRSHPTFDLKRFTKAQAFVKDIGEAVVLFLPCATYNWTPPEGAGQFHGMPLDVKVVHFKGSRKRLMLESWNFFSSTSDISDMLCLILASGRTKYDF